MKRVPSVDALAFLWEREKDIHILEAVNHMEGDKILFGFLHGYKRGLFRRKNNGFTIVMYRGSVDLYGDSVDVLKFIMAKLIKIFGKDPDRSSVEDREETPASFADDIDCCNGRPNAVWFFNRSMADSSNLELNIRVGDNFKQRFLPVP